MFPERELSNVPGSSPAHGRSPKWPAVGVGIRAALAQAVVPAPDGDATLAQAQVNCGWFGT